MDGDLDNCDDRMTYMCNSDGRLVGRRYPEGSRMTFAYDTALRRRVLIDPDGSRTTTIHDANGRLRLLVGPENDRTTYLYDAAGRRTAKIPANGVRTSLAYDAANRTSRIVHQDRDGTTISSFDYTFDPSGDRTGAVELDGSRTTWSYDAARRLVREVRSGVGAFAATHVYDAAGNRLVNIADGSRETFAYDAANRVGRIAHVRSDGATLAAFAYRYDPAGNRTAAGEADGSRTTWTYDPTDRLTREALTGANAFTTTHVYDAVGNRLRRIHDGARTTFTYDAANQSKMSVDGAVRTTFAFYATGNQQVENANGARTTYAWDYENRMTALAPPTGTRSTYAYDPDGLRSRSDEGATATRFVWDDEQRLLVEKDAATNATTASATLEPVPFGRIVSTRRAANHRWPLFTAIGTTAILTNGTAAATDTYILDAYGVPIAQTGTTVNPVRFVGEWGYYGGSGGLVYVRARWYVETVGR
ncbi:MAG: hypothetical protein ACRDD1_19870, partial [Planctomycetia bacterium]